LEPPDANVLESEYIALGLVNLISAYRPERVVLSGGVMHEVALLPRVRQRTRELLEPGYFPEARRMEELVVGPGLGDAAGVVGAILLAAELRPGYLQNRSVGRLASHVQAGLIKA
jgi:fructokinase